MSLMMLVATLIVVGIVLWGINAFPAIDPTIKRAITVIVIVAVCLWVLFSFVGVAPVLTRRLW